MTLDLSRRTVLRGLIAAPMIVQASSLMPVTSRWLKKLEASKIHRVGLRWGDQLIYGGRRFTVTGIGITIDNINPGYSYADVRAVGVTDPPRPTFLAAEPAAVDVADLRPSRIHHQSNAQTHPQWVVGAHTPFMAMGMVTEELSFRCDLDLVGP